jgi:pimeloyl-CoA dehydrogenase small subunit
MDFDLSEEQHLLKESVGQLLTDQYDFAARRKALAEPEGWSRALWRQFANLGLLGLSFPENLGGSAAGPVETMIVMEAMGRALVVEPYLATSVLCGGLLRRAATATQQAVLVPALVSGEQIYAFAHAERHSRYDLTAVDTIARRDGSDFVIDGAKSLVLHGDSADRLIVLARTTGSGNDRQGLGLFVVPAMASGVVRRGYPTQDGQRAAEIEFDAVRITSDDVLGDPEGAAEVVEQVVDEAMAALCAEAVGAMAAALDLTLDYLRTRRQFGVPIGSFQALQHRAVDMLMALEQARSMAMLAAMMASESDAEERSKAVASAKVQIGRSGRFIGQQAVQLHGGIGMTAEHHIGHYLKRLTAINIAFGDADHHLARLAWFVD